MCFTCGTYIPYYVATRAPFLWYKINIFTDIRIAFVPLQWICPLTAKWQDFFQNFVYTSLLFKNIHTCEIRAHAQIL
jgi:hypothetical protein